MTQKTLWHAIPWQEALKILHSDANSGLTEEEAAQRRQKFGRNILPEEKTDSLLRLALDQFKSPLIYILLLAGLVTVILGETVDSIIIFFVILLNIILGFFQEKKAADALRKLKKALKNVTTVLRGGNLKVKDWSDLVPGDVVELKSGDRVPADARIIDSHNLKLNEMALTGEWLSSGKYHHTVPADAVLADRDNIIYMGTVVEEGEAKAIIFATGASTELGRIAEMIRSAREKKTPLQKKILHFSEILGLIILFICLVIFIEGIIIGKSFLEMFTISVAMAVAAIPECLPATITIILSLGAQRILRKKGLIRKLLAAETLGSTDVICTDKTLTLTEGQMEVSDILSANEILEGTNENRQLVLKIAALAGEAFIENPRDSMKKWIVRGRPTERALLLAAVQSGIHIVHAKKEIRHLADFPFDSKNKYSANAYEIEGNKDFIYVLGAPEKLLAMSSRIRMGEQEKNLIPEAERQIELSAELLAKSGCRVVAVAYKKIDSLSRFFENLVFVGLISLKDPLRSDAKKAMELCRSAGMKPIIITGDHKLTAVAVAKELGFAVTGDNILEGKDLDSLSDKELYRVLEKISVYARVEPKHKMRIVDAWQDKGRVVAMIGDGVNDAPALKKANIGVSLGSGTDVAKETSDLVLLKDNFSIIVAAVEEGRRIIDNIRKIITYLLVGGFTEVMLIGLSIIWRLPLPILPAQILWKNMVESTPPSMALAVEPKEKDIMKRPPENPKIPLLTQEMKVLIFIIGLFSNIILFFIFIWFLRLKMPLEVIRSVMFVGLSIDSFFYVFSCRNLRKNIWQYNPFGNQYLNLSVLCGFLMLFLAIYVPFFQKMLKTAGLGLFEWTVIVAFGLLNLVLIEIAKWFYVSKKIKI